MCNLKKKTTLVKLQCKILNIQCFKLYFNVLAGKERMHTSVLDFNASYLFADVTLCCFVFCCLFTNSFAVYCSFCKCLGLFTHYTVCKSVFMSVNWTWTNMFLNLFIKLYFRGLSFTVKFDCISLWRGQYIVRKTTEWNLHKCMLCELCGLIIPYLIDWEFSLKTLFMFGTNKLHSDTELREFILFFYIVYYLMNNLLLWMEL